MAWYRAGGGGIPASLKSGMNAVLNKKFGTTGETYAPNGWPDNVNLLGKLPEKTVSGAIVTFADGADEVPLKKCEVSLSASLDGYSEVDVVHCGKNLLGMTERASSTTNGITSTISANNTIMASGTSSGNGDIYFDLDADLVLNSAVTYTISFTGTDTRSGTLNIYLREKGGSYKSPLALGASAHSRQISGIDGTIDRILLRTSNNNTITMNAQLQIEVGSSATDFEPYTAPTTHTATLGRTIHGGSVDVVNGQGTSTHANVKVSELTWTKQTASGRDFFIAQVSDMKTGTPKNIASVLPYGGEITVAAMADKSLASWTNSLRIYDTDITSVSELLEAYGNDGISYPLATPETFTFDTISIDSKLGNNTLWAEQGDSEVTYRRDIDLALGE